MLKKSISILLVSALTMAQVSCRTETKTADSEVEAVQALALVVVGWEAILGYIAVGGAITIGGYTLWTFSKPDAVTAEFERQTKEENSTLSGQYNQHNNSIGATPNAYISAMKIDRAAIAKIFESSRAALLRSRMNNYRNGGCVVATVSSIGGGSSGTRWEGKEAFSSQFDVIAAKFTATAKAYGKCFKDAMENNSEFRGAVQDIVMQDSPLPTDGVELAYFTFAWMQKVGPDLLKACSLPSYAYTYNKASCQ